MATVARSAPLPGKSALVEDPQFQEIRQRSLSLTRKMLLSIPDTHKSCVYTQTLQLNSPENSHFMTMAIRIGIPPLPELDANLSSTSLAQMSEGLQLHRALLNSVSHRLKNTDKVKELMADIKDLTIQINKMLNMQQSVVQPTPTPVTLRLPVEYDVQVAAHLTLVQLQHFGEKMVDCLSRKDNEDETDR